jgi:hypothetical protein
MYVRAFKDFLPEDGNYNICRKFEIPSTFFPISYPTART